MTVADPVRIDHMKRTLRGVFSAALSELPTTVDDNRFVWVKQGGPRPPRPYIGMQIIDGPDARGITKEEDRYREALTSKRVTITGAVDAIQYRIRVNGMLVEIVSGVAATLTSIRDALRIETQAMIDLGQGEPLTLLDVGGDAFDVIPVVAGDLLGVSTLNPSTEVSLADTVSDVWVIETVADVDMTVQCTVFDAGDAGPDTTRRLSGRLRKALDLPDTLETAERERVAMRAISNTIDLAGLEPGGAKLQAQSSFDVQVGGSSVVATRVEPIETVIFTANVSGKSSSVTIPAP